ncbi:unknown [Gryllus bimaculatus nudivirus]|uniref:Uncharacterized protein n=1 Tax=Gryllus bimaculatus nudivirus TaxID=432587 RepID=A4L1Y4_9VIRU|nr:hypothetical protein GrBNV_gp21 [Gryllus bimaculatus nudivirus]ABO45354.1 unknown [Gryllus bimaculatus nudivirus]
MTDKSSTGLKLKKNKICFFQQREEPTTRDRERGGISVRLGRGVESAASKRGLDSTALKVYIFPGNGRVFLVLIR